MCRWGALVEVGLGRSLSLILWILHYVTAEVEGCLKLQLGSIPIDTCRPKDFDIHGGPGLRHMYSLEALGPKTLATN